MLDQAHREAVTVEKYGRRVTVMVPPEEYDRMKEAEERELDELERRIDAMLEDNRKRPYYELTPALWDEMMNGPTEDLPADDLSLPPVASK